MQSARERAAVAELLRPVTDQLLALATGWEAEDGLRLAITKAVAFWQEHASLVSAMSDAAATAPAARAIRYELIEDWGRHAAARIDVDRRSGAAGDGIDAPRLAWMLAALTVCAMERDVRELMDRDHGIPDLADALSSVWVGAIYGSTASG